MKHEIMRRRDDHSPAAVTRRLAGFLVIGVLASSCGHVGNGVFPSPSGSSVSLSPAATATVDPANLAYAQLLHDPYFSMYVGFRAAISPCVYLDLHLCRVKDQQVISDGQHLQEVLAGVTPPRALVMANTELVQATNSLIAALQKRIKFIHLNEESKFIKVGAVGRGGGPPQAGSALLL